MGGVDRPRAIGMVTIVMTYLGCFFTLLLTTHEPPSSVAYHTS